MIRHATTQPWVFVVIIFLSGASLESAAQPLLEGAAIVARAKPSVVKLLVLDDQRQPIGSGSGFLVSADGLAVTNYHVVRRGSAFAVELAGSATRTPAIVWYVNSELDLALIQLRDANNNPLAGLPALQIATTRPSEGEPAWAIGFPLPTAEFSVTTGIISGIRESERLPEEIRVRFSSMFAGQSVWIQTTCQIDHGNSGGPLLNGRSEVIGVNTLALAGYSDIASSSYFALSAGHLRGFIDARPLTPIQHSIDSTSLMHLPPPRGQVDIPQIESPVRKRPHTFLASRLDAIESMFVCSQCKGTGATPRTVTTVVGQERSGNVRIPIVDTSTVDVICPRCDGNRLNRREVVDRAFGQAIIALAETELTQWRPDPTIERFKAMIQTVAEHSDTILYTESAELLRQQRPVPKGSAVVVEGNYVDLGTGEKVLLAPDGSRYLIVGTNVGISEILGHGVVGGRYAGSVISSGMELHVLQDSFVVTVGDIDLDLISRLGANR